MIIIDKRTYAKCCKSFLAMKNGSGYVKPDNYIFKHLLIKKVSLQLVAGVRQQECRQEPITVVVC